MKKTLSLVLSLGLLHIFSFVTLANETPKEKAKRAMLAAEVKAGIASIGAGNSTRVRVLLNDKTKYHGYITEIRDDYFVVTEARTGATAPIAYTEVKGIKGNNLSTGAKIGIGVAIAAAVAIVAVIVSSGGNNDDKQSGNIICVTSPCVP